MKSVNGYCNDGASVNLCRSRRFRIGEDHANYVCEYIAQLCSEGIRVDNLQDCRPTVNATDGSENDLAVYHTGVLWKELVAAYCTEHGEFVMW